MIFYLYLISYTYIFLLIIFYKVAKFLFRHMPQLLLLRAHGEDGLWKDNVLKKV